MPNGFHHRNHRRMGSAVISEKKIPQPIRDGFHEKTEPDTTRGVICVVESPPRLRTYVRAKRTSDAVKCG